MISEVEHATKLGVREPLLHKQVVLYMIISRYMILLPTAASGRKSYAVSNFSINKRSQVSAVAKSSTAVKSAEAR
jgi:hypothetical protein